MKEDVVKILDFLDLKKNEISEVIEVPKDKSMGDYAFPCFYLARKLKKNPSEIAKNIVSKIKSKNINSFEYVKAVGPYVNFFLERNKLSEKILKKVEKEKNRYGALKRKGNVVIEFPSPNTNKPLHLGHARNIALGQSVSRIFEFCDNDLKVVNLNNDRGVHICKSIVAYDKFGRNSTPKKAGKKPDHFVGDFYVKFAKESEKDKNLEKEAEECLRKWESGDKKIVSLCKKMNAWALEGFKETYKIFELKFDKEYFESDVYESGRKIILDMLKKGKVKKKDGAVFVDLSDEGLGEKVLLRADGTSIYITQDLYLAIVRHKEFKFDRAVYITAREQEYHFRVLFTLLKKFGYRWADKLEHLSYGMVNLESGRMKSREGNVVDIDDLVENMKKMALKEIEKRHKIGLKEREERALKVAMSALRYYLLKIEKTKDMVFKPEESLSFEGDTGPYLLYSYARARSVLRKAGVNKKRGGKSGEINDEEKEILSEIGRFGDVVESSYESSSPNLIANYSYELARMFNEFYHKNKVIGGGNEAFRLRLVRAFAQTLKNSLHLLNIEALEEM